MGSDQVYTHSEEQATSPVVGGQHNMNSVVFLKAFVLLHFISLPTFLPYLEELGAGEKAQQLMAVAALSEHPSP